MKTALSFLSWLFFISACNPQNQVKPNPSISIKSIDTSNIQIKRDTTPLLKFTSGVRSILEDSKGNIWFGSHQEGLALFDGISMTYFTTKDGLSHNQVRSIYEDHKGTIWFECGTGISSYHNGKITTPLYQNYASKEAWQSHENDLWFKEDEINAYNQQAESFGVYRYDGKSFSYHRFPIPNNQNHQSSYAISTPFVKGKNSSVWFGTYAAVFGYNKAVPPIQQADFTIINNKMLGHNDQTGYLHVRSLFEDKKGNLWIGNNGIGVLLYDGNKTINFSAQQGLISENSLRRGGYRSPPNSLEHVFAIGADHQGHMWFGDRDTGAWKYDGQSMKNYTIKDGLTCKHIWQIYHTPKGELWFAMGNGQVLAFNGTSFERMF